MTLYNNALAMRIGKKSAVYFIEHFEEDGDKRHLAPDASMTMRADQTPIGGMRIGYQRSGAECLELFPAARHGPKQQTAIQETVSQRILAHTAFHEGGLVSIPHGPEQALEKGNV